MKLMRKLSVNRPRRFWLLLLMGSLLVWGARTPCAAQTKYLEGPDSHVQAGVPQGQTFQFDLIGKKYYPGTKSTIIVYVPAEYTPDKPACLCVGLDGPNYLPQTVFDNLIAKKQMPVTIGVFVTSGTLNKPGTGQPVRFDRCYEFDSINDTFDRFLVEEVLPAVEQHQTSDGRVLRFSADPNDHMIYGGSSGGVCAFTAAWQHPDLFRRVFTAIGTFVGMRGADMYPTLIRKTEPKPIRIFQQDGAQDTWNPLFDNWYTQNRSVEESLSFAGYDNNHSWGKLGHEGTNAQSLFPDVVKWLWRDYPAPIRAGRSGNSMLESVLVRDQGWQPVLGSYTAPAHLAVSPSGEVYFTDGGTAIRKIGADGATRVFCHSPAPITAAAFGPDGRLYAALPDGRVLCFSAAGRPTLFASGIHAQGLFVASSGGVYASEPGIHDDMPSRLWLIKPNGAKTVLDTGLHDAAGLLLTPDHNLLFAAEGRTHWIYSYAASPAGTALQDKQRFYWLHTAESADDDGDGSGATDIADDSQGNLYVATRMGVQICDRNGRVEGILTLPAGAVSSLSFGGAKFDHLYIVCGGRLYQRPLQVPGVPGFAPPQPLPDFGGG